MKGLTDKAKSGDLGAAKFVLDFLTGPASKPVRAEPPVVIERPTVEVTHSVKVLRRLAAHFLRVNGPSPVSAVAAQLEVTVEETGAVLECDWFQLDAGQWELTPAGKREVG